MGIIAIIASVIGARVFHIVVESPMYYLEKPIRVFCFWQGGYVSIGAYMFTMAAWLVYFWKRNLSTWSTWISPRWEFRSSSSLCRRMRMRRVLLRKANRFSFISFNNPASVPAAFGYAGVHTSCVADLFHDQRDSNVGRFLFLYHEKIPTE